MEIEKKFLIGEMPIDLSKYSLTEIKQSYISYTPEIRIRKRGNVYYLTQKGEGDLTREEIETEINEATYKILLNLTQDNSIEKTRYEIPLDDYGVAELDIYHGNLNGLCTVEIEFLSLEQSKEFNPPNWFGQDITSDERYKNKNLARCDNVDFLITDN